MNGNYPDWMWSEACSMLVQAERLHRQLFRPAPRVFAGPSWEPPIDVLETEFEVLVLVAVPGVNPNEVEATIDESDLLVAGTRILPAALRTAVIHRLELPQGCFRRQLRLPAGTYGDIRSSMENGCLTISLHKFAGR